MRIKRLVVQEGFFDGLDLQFSQGLNVLIGGRGVGKTSVIELIRFGLGVQGLTPESNAEAMRHARSILQSGQVIIELEEKGETIKVSRSGTEDSPDVRISLPEPIIFSQKEIEGIALDSAGRLKLVDSFLLLDSGEVGARDALIAEIRSKCVSIAKLREEIDELDSNVSHLNSLSENVAALTEQQEKFSKANSVIAKAQSALSKLQDTINAASIDDEHLAAFEEDVQAWIEELLGASESLEKPVFSDPKLQSEIDDISKAIASDQTKLHEMVERARGHADTIGKVIKTRRESAREDDNTARTLRSKIESHQEGAGKVARELGNLSNEIAKIEHMRENREKRKQKLAGYYSDCLDYVDELGDIRRSLFERRKKVVKQLNKSLDPYITLEISHLGELVAYEAAILSTLQGSGLKYREIAPLIARRISPEELLEIVSEGADEEFASILEIPHSRASRLLGYLQETDLGSILTADLEDSANFFLLDGTSYKKIEDLSIGQRCTVALSIALENDSRILLVDQPEDHLDNEFVVDTLIKAIRQRADKNQSIVSSHNANIPVLGDANLVIQLDSNGRRGYSSCEGDLNNPDIVTAIENILEGGKEAFSKRAEFYEYETQEHNQ